MVIAIRMTGQSLITMAISSTAKAIFKSVTNGMRISTGPVMHIAGRLRSLKK